MRRLNLGCGNDIREGWVNLDRVKLPGVDVEHDITNLPLPFENESFDEVLCANILEHIDDFVPLLRDIHRILKPKGKLTITVPHFTSKDAYGDPTHRRGFSVHTFSYFCRTHPRNYYFDFAFSHIEKIFLHFQKRPLYFYNYLLEPLVNLSIGTLSLFEGSPLRMFPATNLEVVMVK